MRRRPNSIADLPEAVPVFPLSGALLLPGSNRPLQVFETRYLDMVDAVLGGDRLVALVQPRDTKEESPQGNVPLREIGTLGRLSHFEDNGEDRYLIIVEGLCRVQLTQEVTEDTAFRRFKIDAAPFAEDFVAGAGEAEVDRPRFVAAVRAYADFADLDIDWDKVDQIGTEDLVNLCCMLSPYGPAEKQMLLEARTLNARAEGLMALAEMEMARGKAGQTLQ